VLSFHRLSRTHATNPARKQERKPRCEIAHRNFHSSLISASVSRRLRTILRAFVRFHRARYAPFLARKAGYQGREPREGTRALIEAVVAASADAAARLITAPPPPQTAPPYPNP